MGLIRIYTKRKGESPSFTEPVVLSSYRNGTTVEGAVKQVWCCFFVMNWNRSPWISTTSSITLMSGAEAQSTALRDVACSMFLLMKMLFRYF